jgi:hypothetical protein
MSSRRFALRALPPVLAVFAIALALACQGQGEGAPCDLNNNGSGDCQGGLTCRAVPGVTGTRCCPTTGTSSTVDCTGTQGGVDANVLPTEAGAQGDSGDAAQEDVVDSSQESSAGDAEAGASTMGDSSSDAQAD